MFYVLANVHHHLHPVLESSRGRTRQRNINVKNQCLHFCQPQDVNFEAETIREIHKNAFLAKHTAFRSVPDFAGASFFGVFPKNDNKDDCLFVDIPTTYRKKSTYSRTTDLIWNGANYHSLSW